MMRYTNKDMSYSDLLKQSIGLHYLTLKHSIFCVLVIVILKYTAIYFANLFSMVALQYIIYILTALIIYYFFAVALLSTHKAFIDQPQSLRDSMKIIWNRRLPIYTTFIAYSGGAFAVYFILNYFMIILHRIFHLSSSVQLCIMILMVALFILYMALFYFSFVLSVIDEKPINKAFYQSMMLTEKNKMGVMISFFILDAAILIVTPGMIQEYFLSVYHLDVLFDVVALCVAIPLYINFLLLLLHDTKQQVVLE